MNLCSYVFATRWYEAQQTRRNKVNGLKSLLKSRKFWLAIAAIGVAVAVDVFGVSETSAAELADKIVAIILVLIGAIAAEDVATKLRGKKVGDSK